MGEFFTNVKDWFTGALNEIQTVIFALLPDSPFLNMNIPDNVREILGYINWVVPFYMIGNTLLAWIGAIAVYYAYQTVFRWIKSIQ